jgi:hypothetical protein
LGAVPLENLNHVKVRVYYISFVIFKSL